MSHKTLLYALSWIAGLTISLQGWEWNSTSLLLCSCGLLLIGYLLHMNNRMLIVAVMVIFIVSSTYGTWISMHHRSVLPEQHSDYTLKGTIVSPVEVDGDRVRFIAQVEEVQENVAVSIRLASEAEQREAGQWRRGNLISIHGELALPPTARNFGQFDYRQYMDHQGVYRMLLVKGLESTKLTANHSWSPSRLLNVVDRMRSHMASTITELYPKHQSGFMSSMLIGWKANLSEDVFSLFSELGLTHIIAISGLHVAIVVGGWMGLLRFLRVTRETNITSAMVLIPIYVLISGGSPSIVRAGIMALIALYAARRHWLKDGLNIVGVTAILMTMWNPYYIYDVSFQLSFVVTVGLIVGTPAVVRWIHLGPAWLNGMLAVTVVAQAVSLPLTLYYFNQFSFMSGLANFMLVPIFSFIVLPLGYVSLILNDVFPIAATWLAGLAYWCNEACFWLMGLLEAVPFPKLVWASPSISWIAVYVAVILCAVWGAKVLKEVDGIIFPRLARRARTTLIVCSVIGVIWLIVGFLLLGRVGLATISFLDVGQGDAALIRTPDNRVILVDGGGTQNFQKAGEEWQLRQDPYDIGQDLLVPLLKKRAINRIDELIITHSDMDHIGGLQAVIEEIPIGRILFNGTYRANSYTEKLFATAVERGIPIIPVWAGRELVVDEHTRLNFLYPIERDRESDHISQVDDQNGISVVFVLSMYDSTFLFTGDMEGTAEREVLANMVEKRRGGEEVVEVEDIDVLKVAHHGSKTSTTESWLNLWQPRTAVISVGERNMYRHPSPEVIERLDRKNVTILRTDVHGEVQMKVGENRIEKRVFIK